MLIVSHDHDIIYKFCLFLPIIMLRVFRRYIMIHGKDQSLIRTGQGHFSYHLYIGFAHLFGHRLKVEINAVQTVFLRLFHHIVDKILPETALI